MRKLISSNKKTSSTLNKVGIPYSVTTMSFVCSILCLFLPGKIYAENLDTLINAGVNENTDIITEVIIPDAILNEESTFNPEETRLVLEEDITENSPAIIAKDNSKNKEQNSVTSIANNFNQQISQFNSQGEFILSDAEVPMEVLLKSRTSFRKVFNLPVSQTASAVAENAPNFSVMPMKQVAFASLKDMENKTLTIDAQGKLIELNPQELELNSSNLFNKPNFISGKNWVVRLADSPQIPTSVPTIIVKTKTNINPEKNNPFNLLLTKNASPIIGGFNFSGSEIANIYNNPITSTDNTTNTTSENSTSSIKRVSFQGRVVVPTGSEKSEIVIRIAGTGWQTIADKDGFFDFPALPLGSKFELLVWDSEGKLTRRLVPVNVTELNREFIINLEKSSVIDTIATAFNVKHEMVNSGFCATVITDKPEEMLGAKLSIVGNKSPVEGPFYFGSNNLPDPSLTELSADGRACFFNIKDELLRVQVSLTDGKRRNFVVHTKPSVFEYLLTLNVTSAVYRPVVVQDMADVNDTLAVQAKGENLRFAHGGIYDWLDGTTSAMWAEVKGGWLSTDSAYEGVNREDTADSKQFYFPLGDEYLELRNSASFTQGKVFTLPTKDTLLTKNILKKMKREYFLRGTYADKNPLAIKLPSEDLFNSAQRDNLLSNDPNLFGQAFISANLGYLDLEYADVRLSLRDTWTGQPVGAFNWLPLPAKSTNPRFARGFFVNLPEGQYTLLIADKSGVVKWIDVVRSYPGEMQVISIGE